MSQFLSGKTKYEPSKEYYFLDYQDSMDVRWTRIPYMTIEEIQIFIYDRLPFIYDKDQKKCIPMFGGLRITPMKKLEELYRIWNEETQEWEDDTITLAAQQFGFRYDCYGWLEGPAPSLTKRVDETAEEWKVRVQQRREELEKQMKEECLFSRQTRTKALENYPNERVALLVGMDMRRQELDSFRASLWEEEEEESSEASGVEFG